MNLNAEDAVEYIPEHDDNRDLPEDEQVSLTIWPMTGGEFRAYTRSVNTKKSGNLEKVVERIVVERVSEVRNYTDIKGVPVETGKELFDQGEISFVDEVFAALTEISTLKGGLRKK
tara:strand:+ start:3359 stop:3706 length:348 start_codon:yes stop_codon:yes gene_type:complete